MTDVKPSNRIYLTYKARIKAESRYRLYSMTANILIIWYSFLIIVASIAVSSNTVVISHFETALAASSIAIFASSVFLATGILQKRADEYRACYLELQEIWDSSVQEEVKLKRYSEARKRYPNHSSRDDGEVILSTWLRKGELFDTKGKVPASFSSLSAAVLRRAMFWVTMAAIFLGPVWYAPRFITVQ
ncbi:SLATT domain-containing protein [Qipengyuania psychrotolerans]|uniref:SLATT domain-containing protein n=1 Tax=Qipengyuania psychrotolerans TaxID=2867238 RepID=A0ABX8ZAQ5_9SPHN|nr:SLATT domain-containing protein [Qipengyuania psychrotolerans]QZD86067.1 SLATT domain-containing protein [Qipengyuania psychrotolerans]